MRQGTNHRRARSRGNGKRFSSPRNQNLDSSGPDVKIRGTAQQVLEKYLVLARDATTSGDRIAAESFFQHADHYYRVIHADSQGESGDGQGRNQRAPRVPPPSEREVSPRDPKQPAVPAVPAVKEAAAKPELPTETPTETPTEAEPEPAST